MSNINFINTNTTCLVFFDTELKNTNCLIVNAMSKYKMNDKNQANVYNINKPTNDIDFKQKIKSAR